MPQLFPHRPQLSLDVLVSTQLEPHFVCPAGHTHVPPDAAEPEGHDWTQTPPLQSPEAQVPPAVHTCPLTERQAPLTSCVPVGQTQVLVARFHSEPEGDWHEHFDDPGSGAVEPWTHLVHGGPPPGP